MRRTRTIAPHNSVLPAISRVWAILIAALALCLASCARGPLDDGVLRLWKAAHGETQQDWDALVAPFERQYDIDVQVVPHPWDGWDERYAAAFTGGRPPDVSYMPEEFWPRYAAAHRLARLDSLFPAAVDSMRALYPDNLWRLGQLDGRQYAIPYLYVSWQLLYNRSLFDAAGLPYPPALPDSPGADTWTWETFLEAARTLTRDIDGDGATDQWGFAWSTMDENPNTIYPFLWQGGADLLNADRTANGFATRGLVGLEFMLRLASEGVVPEGGMHTDPSALLFQGRAAMAMVPSTLVRTYRRDFHHLAIGAAIVPRGPATHFYEGRGSFGNSGFWVVADESPRRDLAFALVRYLSRKEQVDTMMDISFLFGARLDWQPPADEPLLRTSVAARRFLVPYPLHKRLRLIHSTVRSEVQAAMLGHKTAAQALAHAGAEVDAFVAHP